MDALTTPLNWQKIRLGDMTTSFTKQTGFDYSAFIKPTLIKEYLPNYIPFIQNKDFLGHYINYKTDYFIPNEIAIRFPQILLNEKCLLISISGAIGKVAVFNHSQDAFIGGAIAVLKFKEKKSLDFAMHFLMSASGQKLLLNGVKSSSHKNLTIADLRNLLIPLPPLNEQIAIANILSAVDRYLYALDALILKKESVKKALSFELLSQRKRLKGFNQAWQKIRLGDIAEIKRGVRITKNELDAFGKYPVVSGGVGFLGYTNNFNRYENTITIAQYGTAGYVNFQKNKFWANDICFCIYPNKDIIKNIFLYYFLKVNQNYLYEISNRNATPYSISKDKILDFEILLPPLNEQIAIANILSAVDNEIVSLKNKKRQFENIKKALNHDLMSAKIRV